MTCGNMVLGILPPQIKAYATKPVSLELNYAGTTYRHEDMLHIQRVTDDTDVKTVVGKMKEDTGVDQGCYASWGYPNPYCWEDQANKNVHTNA